MLQLNNMGCNIWILFLHQVNSAQLVKSYVELLNAEEETRYRSYINQEAAFIYLCSRALLKTIISSYLSIPPAELLIVPDLYGKPKHIEPRRKGRQIYFNLTHTRGMVALSVSRSNILGIDAEYISESIDFMDIALDNFLTHECDTLNSVVEEKRRDWFYKLWTLKESYLKARGEGLTLPLSYPSFSFTNEGTIKCTFDEKLDDNPSNWQFNLFYPTTEHVVSVSIKVKEGALPINIFEIIPLEKPAVRLDLDIISSDT